MAYNFDPRDWELILNRSKNRFAQTGNEKNPDATTRLGSKYFFSNNYGSIFMEDRTCQQDHLTDSNSDKPAKIHNMNHMTHDIPQSPVNHLNPVLPDNPQCVPSHKSTAFVSPAEWKEDTLRKAIFETIRKWKKNPSYSDMTLLNPELGSLFDDWLDSFAAEFNPDYDHETALAEMEYAWEKTKYAEGESLLANCYDKSKNLPHIPGSEIFMRKRDTGILPAILRLLRLCKQLSIHHGFGVPFPLAQNPIADILGIDQSTACLLIQKLVRLQFLAIEKSQPKGKRGKATTVNYTGP